MQFFFFFHSFLCIYEHVNVNLDMSLCGSVCVCVVVALHWRVHCIHISIFIWKFSATNVCIFERRFTCNWQNCVCHLNLSIIEINYIVCTMRTCYKATNNKHWRNRQRVKWDGGGRGDGKRRQHRWLSNCILTKPIENAFERISTKIHFQILRISEFNSWCARALFEYHQKFNSTQTGRASGCIVY